ncbi:MAG: pyridoxal phosphate-dependent aminotransferase, partial [Desulfobulbaceae bacterium]|nr:pyridoxal phosphate-dependent aminotransferase [Desulfobulbaceae bacterium]
MTVSKKMVDFSKRASWIRRMFEQGAKLKAQFGAENVFDFSLGNPDLRPPEQFYRTIRSLAAEEGQGRHGYMPNAGYPEVRGRVAAQVSSEQGVIVSSEELLMTCGAAGALNVVLKALLDPGDEVIILAPFFVEYNFYVDNHGGITKIAPTRSDFDLDVNAVDAAITEKTKAIIVNSPNNPTGQIYSSKSMAELGRVLESAGNKHGTTIYLISDEPYRKIVYDNHDVPSIFKAYKNSIVVSSYSKDLSLPGERIGYLAVHPEIDEKALLVETLTLANRILGFVNAPALMQRVVGELQGLTVDSGIYAGRRELFCRILGDAGYDFVPPKGAFYIFPKSPMESDVDFVAILQQHKILAVPGLGFGQPGYFRLAFCVEDDVIERSADAFKKAMDAA